MSRVSPLRLKRYLHHRLRLGAYLRSPGDGRVRPVIPAWTLLWGLLMGQILRECSFHAIEALVGSPARRRLGLQPAFGDDALAYFTERLDPGPTRASLIAVAKRAKRNKAFENSRFIGLAFDGTAAGWSSRQHCPLCHPIYNAQREIVGYRHQLSLTSVVGAGLSLPLDIEPYGPGDSEQAASQRLLTRVVAALGAGFADYVVADGLYATAPWLHRVRESGLRSVVRLKGNLPELLAAAQARFEPQPPTQVIPVGRDRVELWDADDFDPWETLNWSTVRVLRYRQHKPDGTVVEAYWLTDWPRKLVGALALYHMAKSRWEIENQGFNEAKNHQGLEHIAHHQANSLLAIWLLTLLAMVVERLFRQRFLHRGTHPILAPIELVRALRLSLAPPRPADTS